MTHDYIQLVFICEYLIKLFIM